MTKENVIGKAKRLSRWFEIDLTISIFGVQILHWHYPPQENEPNVEQLKEF